MPNPEEVVVAFEKGLEAAAREEDQGEEDEMDEMDGMEDDFDAPDVPAVDLV